MGVSLDRTKNEDCQVKQGKCITTKLNSMMAQQVKALLLYKPKAIVEIENSLQLVP